MDLVFAAATEPHHLLALADLYHELAHFVLVRMRKEFVTPAQAIINQQFDQLVAEARRKSWSTDTIAFIEDSRRQWLGAWYREFACDMIATYWAGPAYGWCNVRLCANLSSDLFQGMDSHPADDARNRAVMLTLERTGHAVAAQQIQGRWAELIALSTGDPPTKYELGYPPQLLESLANFVVEACEKAGFTRSPEATSNAPAGEVTATLNAAWNAFLADATGFAEREQELLEALRASLQ
jgi:hypothetical protein